MSKWVRICTVGALALAVTAATATAGLNTGAVAKMYWQTGSTGAAIAARDNTNGTCQLVVTCKGLTNFAGADVQLLINALDKSGPPPAWQGQSGGCAEGFITGYPGGRGGTIFRNAYTTAPAVPGPLASQNGEFYNTGDCKTPHNVALLWLSDAGGAGVARTSTLEYAIWAIAFDLANSVDPVDGVTPCGGGASDPNGVIGVCIAANFRLPCTDPQQGQAIETLDGNFAVDFPQFVPSFGFLTWNSGAQGSECPNATPVLHTTWGQLKKAYK
jgi:hypothetical protein